MARSRAGTRARYHRFTSADLPAAHRLSLEVKWPHRLSDWKLVHGLGAGYVAEDERGLIGTVLYWKFGRRQASLGMVIVTPRAQGRGIGRKLMDLALADLEGRDVLLAATAVGQPLYEALGFVPVGIIAQHQGIAGRVPALALPRGERLRPIGSREEQRLVSLDRRASGLSRDRAMRALLRTCEGIVLDRGGDAIGFALLRRFGRGLVIGPVVAPDAPRAKALIGHWVAANAGRFVRIDVDVSRGIGPWLDSIGLAQASTGVTMARGAPPPADREAVVFGLINQALG